MRRPRTLPAFSADERTRAHVLLATRVAFMMARKFEEGDWAHVYCSAKKIPNRGWSNLNLDIMYKGLGVEHKMLGQPSDKRLSDVCGTRLMHPAATRSIRVPFKGSANKVMQDVLKQYADLLEQRRAKVAEDAPGIEPDMRTGWLLWQPNLIEFLYFEEETLPPNPEDYVAEWRESGGGSRKKSRNLWVYERKTGQKRYSITTSAGAKIQPYFDVPPPSDPNLYLFRVQGEEMEPGLIRIWVTSSTERELRRIVGDLSPDNLGLVIANVAGKPDTKAATAEPKREEARPLILTTESYNLLAASFPGVSDEHMLQLLLDRLSRSA